MLSKRARSKNRHHLLARADAEIPPGTELALVSSENLGARMRWSDRAFYLLGTSEEGGWDFPRFAVDHVDGERAPTREKFQRPRARAKEFVQLGLSVVGCLSEVPSESRHSWSIDAAIFGVRADEFHEGKLPPEIEDQPPSVSCLPPFRI